MDGKRESTYERRKAAGLCVRCGGATDGEKRMCAACREKTDAYQRARRARNRSAGRCKCGREVKPGFKRCAECMKLQDARKASGLCVDCGQPLKAKNRLKCDQCIARDRRSNLKRYGRNRARGLCVACGKNPARESRTLCAACAEKLSIRQKRFRFFGPRKKEEKR